MDRPGPDADRRAVPEGPLTRETALAILARADELLAGADFADAAAHYQRVVGYDDPAVTAAALLGLGEARYRLDDEDGAVATWEAVLELGETPSTYKAWRNLAAANVRAGVLPAAKRAYLEADRRAPADDKAEIANRLGWLSKETGDRGAANRYFAKGRGDGPLIPMAIAVIAATAIVSLVVLFTAEGETLLRVLWLDKIGVAHGEYWRLWTVTLVHADLLHLFFNMYALYLAGPIVERWYGSAMFLVMYVVCAAAGSVASFVFGGDIPAVGASGAIFGLFGVLLAAGRMHHPVDRSGRTLVSQLGFLIVLNLVFGFASGGQIDNAAHLGGLFAGLWMGAILPPTRVPTLSSMWQRAARSRAMFGAPSAAPTPAGSVSAGRLVRLPAFVPLVAVVPVAAVVLAGIVVGTAARDDVSAPLAANRARELVVLPRPVGTDQLTIRLAI